MADHRPRYGERYPLTDAQAEKWLGSLYSGQAKRAFSEAVELAFDGGLDAALLETAFAQVMERHEALSMRFAPDGSTQVYEPPSGIALRRAEFDTKADPVAAYEAFCSAQASGSFDPAQPPLVRAWLCRLGPRHWRLLLCAHHLVCDGWSLRIVLQDLAAHYNQLIGDDGARLPPVDSWARYARAERARRDGAAGQQSLRYWLERYRELPEPVRLPVDYPRKPQLSFSAATMQRQVPAVLWQQLRATAREQGVTRFSLLLAGYFVLLYRLTGQQDLVCGIPFAGAAQGAGSRVVGDTDNTLPLRMRVSADESLSAFARRVHEAMREAALHQDVSLGKVVEALALPREPGRLLLVESILTLNPAIERLRFHGLDCRLRVMPHHASAWELAWQWRPLPGKMLLEVQYHSDLYHPTTIRTWCDSYVALLEQMVRDSQISIADSAPGDSDSTAMFALRDERSRDWDEVSLPVLLQAAFSRFSTRCAAQCGDREITYAAIDRASHAVASALIARRVRPGQLIGVCMPRSIDMLVAVLGVLRSGAAYVPLDPSFPDERLRHMAEQAQLALVIAANANALPDGLADARNVLTFDALVRVDGDSDARALPEVDAGSLAYVLYTSGSTGQPKGVCILHRNLVNFLRAMQEMPGFDRDDAICAATTLSFDIAALELYLPLLCGGRVVIADDNEHRDPEALARLIERRGCTVLQTTPSLLALLCEVGRATVLQPLKLLVGGEAFPSALARTLQPRCRELWNLYGPTETTVWSSIARLQGDEQSIPLGKPIANTRIYLLDARRMPALPGALGEIWIGGAGVADGYLHRPDLSAERFIEDPFAADGSRMYRTGDLGRIRDGQLYFHGRIDEQIKLRGYRIEPGEIEAAAATEPSVIECVAVARDAGNGDQVLVLYAGSAADAEQLASRMHKRLAQTLPAYMRPHHIVVLGSLPKTPNGKIDRRALPMLQSQSSGPRDIEPRDHLERELCDTWQRLLQRTHVGIHDNFFEIGGYSLLAVRMFTELHERHGVDLPLSTLIEQPTIAQLADVLRQAAVVNAVPRHSSMPAQATGPVRGSLVELRPGGSATPVFFIHAVGGNVLNYLPLARAVAPDATVYGLQSVGLDGDSAPLSTIEAMADRYVADIHRVEPRGPYLLAGGSMGGLIALEVARRLQALGREVGLLAMFDTYGPGMPQRSGDSPWRPHRWWSLYRRLDGEQRAQLWRRIGFRLWGLPRMRVQQWLARDRSVMPRELRIFMVEKANYAALASYRPERYPGRVVLFRATQADAGDDPTLGWRDYVAGVDIIELGGRHDNIIEQPDLPLRFRDCLDAR